MKHQQGIKLIGTILALAGAASASAFGTGCDDGGSGAAGTGGDAATSGGPTTTGSPASTGTTDPTTVTSTSGGMTTTGGGGNGIDCPSNFCMVGPYTGLGFVYSDKTDGGASSITQKGTSLCGSGVAGAVVGMAVSTHWGAGIGVNLNQKAVPMSPVDPIQLGGSGVTIGISNPPTTEIRAVVDDEGVAYCAVLKSATTPLVWSDFNTTCWDKTLPGSKAMTKAPLATSIKVQVVTSADADRPFDYCIASIAFN